MIQLGSTVKDLISGLTGVAIGRVDWLYGCTRYAVESTKLKKDGKPSDSIWIDEQRLEVTKGGKFKATEPQPCHITLGSKVKDKQTGFQGIAVSYAVWLSGQSDITIEPTTLHDGKPVEAHSFNLERVELIEKALPPVSKSNTARSGGPQNDPKIR